MDFIKIRSRHHREEAAEAQQEDRETGPFFNRKLLLTEHF